MQIAHRTTIYFNYKIIVETKQKRACIQFIQGMFYFDNVTECATSALKDKNFFV